jgi:hypothetical protein
MAAEDVVRALREGLVGAGELGAHLFTGGLGESIAGLGGLANLAYYRDPERAARMVEELRSGIGDAITYELEPGSVAARGLENVGAAMAPVGEALEAPAEYTFEQTGSPALAALVLGTTAAGAELTPGGKVARRSRKLADVGLEPDVVRSIMQSTKGAELPAEDVIGALRTREALRAETPEGRTKPYSEMSDAELEAYGQQYGVDMTQTPMQRFEFDVDGEKVTIDVPGGLDRDKPFTLPDMMRLKAQGVDASKLPEDFHVQLQAKLTDATTPSAEDLADPTYMANRLMFGLQSPNMPLLRNQFLQARMKLRNQADLDELAEATPWGIEEALRGDIPLEQRRAFDQAYSDRMGLGSASTGGMSLRGTPSFADMSDFAKVYRRNPEWFTKPEDLDWTQQMERVMRMRGLSPKTASFGAVWQDPGRATISAVDRHMAREGLEAVLNDPELGPKYRDSTVGRWNAAQRDPENLVTDYAEIASKPGGQSFLDESIFQTVSAHGSAKTRLASGEYNPKIPEHLRGGPAEPAETTIMGEPYKRMLERLEQRGQQRGQNLFAEQWMSWDRIRRRLEPHESMHRDFQKLPRSPAGELIDALRTQSAAGFGSPQGQVKPFDWKKGMYGNIDPRLLGAMGAGSAGYLGAQAMSEEE